MSPHPRRSRWASGSPGSLSSDGSRGKTVTRKRCIRSPPFVLWFPGWLLARVDLELVDGVAVLGGAGGAVHADVPAAAGHVQGLGAAGAGGGGVDGGPGGVVVGGLDLERL